MRKRFFFFEKYFIILELLFYTLFFILIISCFEVFYISYILIHVSSTLFLQIYYISTTLSFMEKITDIIPSLLGPCLLSLPCCPSTTLPVILAPTPHPHLWTYHFCSCSGLWSVLWLFISVRSHIQLCNFLPLLSWLSSPQSLLRAHSLTIWKRVFLPALSNPLSLKVIIVFLFLPISLFLSSISSPPVHLELPY